MFNSESPPPTQQIKQWLQGGSDKSLEIMPGRPPMVDLRPLKGEWLCLPYASLVSVSYDADRTMPLVATFSDHIVSFKGASLQGLYTALGSQRAWCVAAKSLRHNPQLWGMPEGTVLVEDITIERRSTQRTPPTGGPSQGAGTGQDNGRGMQR